MIRLRRFDDNREFSNNIRGNFDLMDWIRGAVSAEFDCERDDVYITEDDFLGEVVTVNGNAVAYIAEDHIPQHAARLIADIKRDVAIGQYWLEECNKEFNRKWQQENGAK